MTDQVKIPKLYIDLIDQLFEIDKKVQLLTESNSINRNIAKMREMFENIFATPTENGIGLHYYNPIGEKYNETRTDLEASIAGNSIDNLVITEVIKPIIRFRNGGINIIARKGLVVVEAK